MAGALAGVAGYVAGYVAGCVAGYLHAFHRAFAGRCPIRIAHLSYSCSPFASLALTHQRQHSVAD